MAQDLLSDDLTVQEIDTVIKMLGMGLDYFKKLEDELVHDDLDKIQFDRVIEITENAVLKLNNIVTKALGGTNEPEA